MYINMSFKEAFRNKIEAGIELYVPEKIKKIFLAKECENFSTFGELIYKNKGEEVKVQPFWDEENINGNKTIVFSSEFTSITRGGKLLIRDEHRRVTPEEFRRCEELLSGRALITAFERLDAIRINAPGVKMTFKGIDIQEYSPERDLLKSRGLKPFAMNESILNK